MVCNTYFGEALSKTEAFIYLQGELITIAQTSRHMDKETSILNTVFSNKQYFFYSNKFLVAKYHLYAQYQEKPQELSSKKTANSNYFISPWGDLPMHLLRVPLSAAVRTLKEWPPLLSAGYSSPS